MMVLIMCSGDDPKKKKADGKRIALTQKHEVAYIKKIAKEQLKKLEDTKNIWIIPNKLMDSSVVCSKAKLIRICKAVLKLIEVYKHGRRKSSRGATKRTSRRKTC